MILVTGASGQLGRATLAHLVTSGAPAAGGTRRPDPESSARCIDFDHPKTLDLTGTRTLLIVSAGTAEDDVVMSRHERVIHAAERDGVGHLIYTSLAGAADHLSFALAHRWTERRIRNGTIPWTILRNGLYAELIAQLATPHNGVIRAPLGTGAVAAVARDDLARAAANVALCPDRHMGRTYELVGSSAITAHDVAEHLGATYKPSTLGELRASLAGAALLPFQAPMLMSIHSAIAGGFLASTSRDLEVLLGRPAADSLGVIGQALHSAA